MDDGRKSGLYVLLGIAITFVIAFLWLAYIYVEMKP